MSVPVSLRDELAATMDTRTVWCTACDQPMHLDTERSCTTLADAVLGSEALQSIRTALRSMATSGSNALGYLEYYGFSPSVVAWVMGDTP